MKTFFLSLSAFLLLSACSNPEPFKGQPKNRLDRLTKEERSELAPNELFLAVFNGDKESVDQISKDSPFLMDSRNQKNGNLAISEATLLEEKEIVQILLERMALEEFFKGNLLGESVMFHFSKVGWAWAIDELAARYYKSLGTLQDFEISYLDFKNHLGQRALHVARNGQVAESLKREYYRGVLEFPYWMFTLLVDMDGKTFLHTAAADSRREILRWAVNHFCGVNSLEKNTDLLWGIPSVGGYVFERGRKAVQTYIGGFGMGWGIRFNQKDHLGKTPLHYAAQNRDLTSLQIITSCEWIDYDLKDVDGDLALQSFLKSLPIENPSLSEDDIQFLTLLMEQRTYMASWFREKADYINHGNHQQDTSLHIAARLADPRPFQILSRYGNNEKLNAQGLTPKELFDSKHARTKIYAH